jgi:hypothetical protein
MPGAGTPDLIPGVLPVRISLFGQPRVAAADDSREFSLPRKTLNVMAYLILHCVRPAARDSIAYALFPDDDEETARGHLRRNLSYLLSSLPPTPHDARFVLSEFERIAWNAMAAAVHVRLDSPGAVGTALCFHRCYGSLLRRRVASHQGLHRLQIGWRQRGLVGSYADMNSRAADSVRDSDHPDTVRLKDLGHC